MGSMVPPFSSNDWPKGGHSLSIHGYWLREWIIPSVLSILNVFFEVRLSDATILLAQEENRKEKRGIESSMTGNKLPSSLVPYLQGEVLSGASEALLLCTNAWAPVQSLMQITPAKRERERGCQNDQKEPYRSHTHTNTHKHPGKR